MKYSSSPINRYHMITCIVSIIYFLGSALYEIGLFFNFNTKSFWNIYLTITSILSFPYFLTTVFFVPYALITLVYAMAIIQFIAQLKEGSKSPAHILISLIAILICTLGMKCADSLTSGMNSLNLLITIPISIK